MIEDEAIISCGCYSTNIPAEFYRQQQGSSIVLPSFVLGPGWLVHHRPWPGCYLSGHLTIHRAYEAATHFSSNFHTHGLVSSLALGHMSGTCP
jgi:hypothetical protein